MDIDYLIYQLVHDSAHLKFNRKVSKWDKGIEIDDHKITVTKNNI